jgi:nucleoside-diphosphate-sugar epimerase
MTRYLVTGGAGFIGSHLVDALVGAGYDVVVLDDFSTGRRENLLPSLDRVRVVEGSVTDLAACKQAMDGVHYVLHQAALPSVPRSLEDPAATHAANATGTLNVLLAARDARVRRLVYASSSSIYGTTPELPKRESMVPRPLSPYAVSKLAGEYYCRAFTVSFGLETVALRYFNVFGPRQDPTSQYAAAVARFVDAALQGTAPVIFGDGEQTRDFTFVGNVVRANLLACTANAECVGQAFNIGCGGRVTVNDLWDRIRRLTGSTVLARYQPPRMGDVRDSLAAVDLARQGLGYEPTFDLDEGLAITIAAARDVAVTS